MVGIFNPDCELLPPWAKEQYLCTVAPLPSLWPPPPSPLLKLNVQYILYTDSVWLGGWGLLNCTVYHILQEFYTLFLTRFRTYKIASPPQTKMTSEGDIKGLVPSSMLQSNSRQRQLKLKWETTIRYESIQVYATWSRVSFRGIPFTQYHILFPPPPCQQAPFKKENSQMDSSVQDNPAAPSPCQYTITTLLNSLLG